MIVLEASIYLSPFAPFIQLLAGICLLFFYCELLKNSPFTTAQTKLCDLYVEIYDELTTKYQVFLPEGVGSIRSNISFNNINHWSSFRSSIYCLAVFCFFYCLLILLISGIESHSTYGLCYSGLLITNTVAILYYIIIFYLGFKNKAYAVIIPLLLGCYIIIHFIFLKDINYFQSFSRSTITIYTLITCILGLVPILHRLCSDWYVIYRCKISINRIKKDFNEWTGFPFNKTKKKNIKYTLILIGYLIKSIFVEENINYDTNYKNNLEKYLKHRVQKELSYLYRKSEQWDKSD